MRLQHNDEEGGVMQGQVVAVTGEVGQGGREWLRRALPASLRPVLTSRLALIIFAGNTTTPPPDDAAAARLSFSHSLTPVTRPPN
ncbi:hypothetical protein E2C01_046273 [Portunus trituberculatus]|uniref:Uncharacterized protein n=1 Tax=Portunus trituberculatus TaxID=210409 RepID=A0A5B7G4T0_PORTR|nr:hypothetical protein [Portunus trituberculatus]